MAPAQIVFYLVATLISAIGIFIQIHRRRLVKHVEKLNPIPLALIPKLLTLNFDNTIDFVRSIEDSFPLRGWIGPLQMLVVVAHPEDIQVILSDPKVAEKAYVYKFLNNDHGLLASQHHIWKVHRKILNPAFSINHIRSNMIAVFKTTTDQMLNRISDNIEGGGGVDCELVNYIKYCLVETSLGAIPPPSRIIIISTSDSVGKQRIHVSIGQGIQTRFTFPATFTGQTSNKSDIEEYCRCMTQRIEAVARRFLNVFYHWDTLYQLTKHHENEQKSIRFMTKFVKNIISEYERNNPLENGPSEGKLVVDLLMNRMRENQITERDVIDELDTIIYTSVDTSTHLIVFTLLMIAMNPEVQQKLVEELQEIFDSPDTPFGYDQLKCLAYMDRVIKETVRLYPIVPFAIKVAKETIKLRNSSIPAGAMTLIPLMSIHENAAIWGPAAKTFNPDNFLPENTKTRHPYSFIPFSAGGRNCIGMIYGKFMITSILARVLMKYRLETRLTREDIQVEYKITLNLKNKNPFRLVKRTDFFKDSGGLKE